MVLDVVDTCDWPGTNLVDIQVLLLTLPAFSLTLPGTTAHGLITKLGADSGGWVLVTRNLFRVLAVGKFLQDLLLALDSLQIFELMARDLFLYMTTGQENIGDREGAISAGLMTEFDAGVLADAGQSRAWLVTECALVVVEVRMTR